MEYDKENWELKIEIRQADIIPEDDDKEKYGKLIIMLREFAFSLYSLLYPEKPRRNPYQKF